MLSSPALGQYRAAQSSAGGFASSLSYEARATAGEVFGGQAVTSNQDTLVTGFYLMVLRGDRLGPSIFFVEVGDQLITPLSQFPPSPIVQPENITIPIATQITDPGSGVEEATLFYKQGGMPSFTQLPMTALDDTYTGSIQASMVGSQGLEYYITAKDSMNNVTRTPLSGAHGIRVRIDSPGLQQMYSGDTTQTGYRLVSVPMELTNASSSNVLGSLGNYDDRFWRIWRLREDYTNFQGDAQYQELRNGTQFDPGDAYWVIARNNWTIQTGQATSISTLAPFTRTLHPGWNFIGNPFNFSIPVQNISLSSGGDPEAKVYQRGWQNTNSLNPFTGYAINAGESDNVVVTIDPALGTTSGKQTGSPPAVTNSLTWGIQIIAETAFAHDRENYIGVNNQASSGWDQFDKPEPPVIGDFVSVSFPHEDWGKIHRHYEADIRPIPSYGDQWEFEVKTGKEEVVQLSFEGIDDVPRSYSIQLIDEFTKTTLDLRKSSTYTIRTAGNTEAYPLTINIGESGYIEEQVESKNLLPNTPTLDQNYPNPFNPTTSIRYGLTRPSIVTLEVYNSLGQVVSTLVNRVSKDAGYHVATWEAISDDGAAISSGLYLYRLSVSPEGDASALPAVITRKMMLIK